MHERPKIYPALQNMNQLHIKYAHFLCFYENDFSDYFQYLYIYKRFSKITSLHTSIFENLSVTTVDTPISKQFLGHFVYKTLLISLLAF